MKDTCEDKGSRGGAGNNETWQLKEKNLCPALQLKKKGRERINSKAAADRILFYCLILEL